MSRDSVTVLVTGGNNRAGLAVARSLARHNVSFLVVGEDRHSVAFHSRCVKKAILSPSPTEQPEAYFEFILQTVKRHRIQLVIPVDDLPLLVFERHREDLEKYTRLAMPNPQALRNVLDKRINLKLANELGIPCPKQYELEHPRQIPEMIDALGVPVVLKPPGSRHDRQLASFPFKVLYAHDEKQLRDYLTEFCPDHAFPLFQECAKGVVHNLCCFAAKGETMAVHEYRSLRRMRGNGVLRMVVEPIVEAEQAARKILRALDWDGVAHIAFFVDPDSKELSYMETNGRLWSSVEGSVYAGWDFPYWIYRYFLHGERPAPGPIRLGSRTCWHRGDLAALAIYLGGGEVPATGTTPGKLQAILQYLGGFSPSIHSDVFRLSDPVPAFIDHWQLLRQSSHALTHMSETVRKKPFSSPS